VNYEKKQNGVPFYETPCIPHQPCVISAPYAAAFIVSHHSVVFDLSELPLVRARELHLCCDFTNVAADVMRCDIYSHSSWYTKGLGVEVKRI